MSERQPYSRVYWSVLHDPKFDGIRSNMTHLGSWTLMLILADMSHPAPAFVPPTIPKRSLGALVDAGLVDLLPDYQYRVHGLDAERQRRAESATRLGPKRDPSGTQLGPERVYRRELDETSTRRADPSWARDGLPNLDAEAMSALVDRSGQSWSLAGDKQLAEYDRLIGAHGLQAVLAAFDAVRDGKRLTARQLVWPAMKLLEPLPDVKQATAAHRQNEEAEAHRRRLEATRQRIEAERRTA